MVITVKDLDKGVKTAIKDELLSLLLKEEKWLPLPTETDKILKVISANVQQLKKIIEEYYGEFFESDDVTVDITEEEFMNVYLNRI
jgi:hypothetical protein